ncbi:MAG: hypothetical protein H6Q80_954 [Deltaproteobacteria bacterium]|nr:hypothetical protein [Deltaproteobacteria bacterium]
MRRSIRMILSFGVGLLLLFSGSIPGYAGSPAPDWLAAEGFRGLSWGATREKAQAVFPDLAFMRYAIHAEKETPWTVYERKNEERKINGIRVDEILYWFQNDSFKKVTVILSSKVGPRTLKTPAAEAFDELQRMIHRVAGDPIASRTQRGGLDGNRKEVWHHGEMSIALSCFEPPGINGEELVLEIVKRTVTKGSVSE